MVPAFMQRQRATIEQIRALHHKNVDSTCSECGHPWPGDTIRKLNGDLS